MFYHSFINKYIYKNRARDAFVGYMQSKLSEIKTLREVVWFIKFI